MLLKMSTKKVEEMIWSIEFRGYEKQTIIMYLMNDK